MSYEEWAEENYTCIDVDNNAREIWNAALDSAAKEVNKIALHNNTIVCAVAVINRQKTPNP